MGVGGRGVGGVGVELEPGNLRRKWKIPQHELLQLIQ